MVSFYTLSNRTSGKHKIGHSNKTDESFYFCVYVLRRVAPVPGDRGPRVVMAVMAVASAPGVDVRRRRSTAGSHGGGQRGDLFWRFRLERRVVAGVVVFKIDPTAPRAARRRHVHAARPASPRRVVNAAAIGRGAGRRIDGRCFF